MSDFLTPADIESILQDPRWREPAATQKATARCEALPQPLPGVVFHEINFRGGRRWMTDERPSGTPWWRFWE